MQGRAWRGAGVVLGSAAALTLSACADRSHAAPAAGALLWWRFALLAICIALLVLHVAYVALSADIDITVRAIGGFASLAAAVLAFTVAGQFTDWAARAVLGWGAAGAAVLVVAHALAGLAPLTGIPLYALALWGFVYPNLTLLLIATAPALATQTAAMVIGFARVVRR
ncbi:MAG: hypothetical protein U0531_00390 [Dehalococcoidia bacterium]